MNAPDPSKQTPAAGDQRVSEPSMEEILASIRRIIADDQSLPNRAFARDDEINLRAALDPMPTPADSPRERAIPERPVATSSMAHEPPAGSYYAPTQPTSSARQPPVAQSANEALSVQKPPAATPRVVSSGSLGHIAAPQFAMPDSPSLRGSLQQKRGPESEAALLRFATPQTMPEPGKLGAVATPARRAEAVASGAAVSSDQKAGIDQKTQEDQKAVADQRSSLFSAATDQSVTAAFSALAASRLVENDAMLQGMVREMIRPMLKSWLDDNLPGMVERMVRAEIERVGRSGR